MADVKLVFFLLMVAVSVARCTDKKVYIIYKGSNLKENPTTTKMDHLSTLNEICGSWDVAKKSLVRSFHKSFNGFAAKLSRHEVEKLKSKSGIVSIYKSRTHKLLTTHSWDYLGLHETVPRQESAETNLVIGILDTGVWANSESFKSCESVTVPAKWRGVCQTSINFTCNGKIIGARNYIQGQDIMDKIGHGTHTASTAAGCKVGNANYFGFAKGIVRGAVPSSKIAVYKVCSKLGCSDENILAAFDDAIHDGVDI